MRPYRDPARLPDSLEPSDEEAPPIEERAVLFVLFVPGLMALASAIFADAGQIAALIGAGLVALPTWTLLQRVGLRRRIKKS